MAMQEGMYQGFVMMANDGSFNKRGFNSFFEIDLVWCLRAFRVRERQKEVCRRVKTKNRTIQIIHHVFFAHLRVAKRLTAPHRTAEGSVKTVLKPLAILSYR